MTTATRVVAATIIDHNDFTKERFWNSGVGFLDKATDVALLIERRNNNRNLHGTSD